MNDAVFCNFNARGNLQDIKGIYVAGDAFIYSVSLMRKLVNDLSVAFLK